MTTIGTGRYRYTLVQGWGNLPHGMSFGRVSCDRENHRVQVFAANGEFSAMWTDVQRPDDIALTPEGDFAVCEHGVAGKPSRVSIFDRDGKVLDLPEHKRAKVKDKDAVLGEILRDPRVHSRVRIDYVPAVGDWKTAWDHIVFEGFFGTRMKMQFTWEGCDSALAAPLVLDLIRLAEFARRAGESGAMTHLACFFKAPYGFARHDLHAQVDALRAYAVRASAPARRFPSVR